MKASPNEGRVRTHGLSEKQFDDLAAGNGDVAAIRSLASSELSWRLLSLRALLDVLETKEHELPGITGPLVPVDAAVALIGSAERVGFRQVRHIIFSPPVGSWLNWMLHRSSSSEVSRRSSSYDDASAPFWVEVGYLHAIAASCAAATHLDFSIDVPVWRGVATLPGLGSVLFKDSTAAQVARVTGSEEGISILCNDVSISLATSELAANDDIRLPSGRAVWWPLRDIASTTGGSTIRVTIDDLDPYRRYSRMESPERLPRVEYQEWQVRLDAAWSILVTQDRDAADALAAGVSAIVPEPAAKRFHPFSASCGDAFGSMLMSIPEDGTEFALTLVHEFHHIKLGAVMHLFPVLPDGVGYEERFHAPWRDDPRPLAGMVQGIYSFCAVTRFWRAHRQLVTGTEADRANFEFALWRRETSTVLRQLRKVSEFTAAGHRIVEALDRAVEPWLDEPVPNLLVSLAEAASRDHEASWRAFHVQPDERVVDEFLRAWNEATEPSELEPTVSRIVPDPAAFRLYTRATVTRLRLSDPEMFGALSSTPEELSAIVPDVTLGDIAYVAGDLVAARRRYLEDLALEPTKANSLVGLGLTLAGGGHTETCLLQAPELVRALLCRLTDPSGQPSEWYGELPEKLSSWIDSSLSRRVLLGPDTDS